VLRKKTNISFNGRINQTFSYQNQAFGRKLVLQRIC